MKKQFKKLHKKPTWNAPRIKRTPFIFASFFGLVMMTYGLSHLLAAPSPVIFTMTPATQAAAVGQTKTVALQINPNGETINGGSVRVTFDANRLTFSKFTVAGGGSPYNLYSQTSGTGVYSFSFFTYYGTTQSSSLGTLEFQVKPVASTTQTSLAYTAGTGTRAYEGSIFNPDYYASQLSGAAITINVPVTPPPPTPPPVTPPSTPPPTPPSATPQPSPTPPGSSPRPPSTSGTQTNNSPANPSSTTPSSDTPASDETVATAPDGSAVPDTNDTSSQESETVAAGTKKKVPLGAIVAASAGGLLFIAATLGYITLRRRHSALKKADNVHGGLFDSKTKPEHPAATNPHAHPLETGATAIAGASAAHAATHEKAVPQPAVQKAPTPPPIPVPQAPKPVAPAPRPPQPAATAPVPPPAPPQQPATNIPLSTPAWQAEIAAQQHVDKVEEPEDMFELAAEHPESFGSTQLLDAEQARQHPPKGPSAK